MEINLNKNAVILLKNSNSLLFLRGGMIIIVRIVKTPNAQ